MAYTRPASNPDWATGAGGATPNVSSAGLPFATGYPDDGAPTAKGWNWLFQLVGAWIGWLDQLTQSLSTGTDLITLSGAIPANVPGLTPPFSVNFQKFASGRVRLWWGAVGGITSGTPHTTTTAILDLNGIAPSATRTAVVDVNGSGYVVASMQSHSDGGALSIVPSYSSTGFPSAVIEYML